MIALLPVIGVVFGALVTYLVARRATSGQIDTSTAETLWKESGLMRGELRQEILDLRVEQRRCDEEVAALKERIAALEKRVSG